MAEETHSDNRQYTIRSMKTDMSSSKGKGEPTVPVGVPPQPPPHTDKKLGRPGEPFPHAPVSPARQHAPGALSATLSPPQNLPSAEPARAPRQHPTPPAPPRPQPSVRPPAPLKPLPAPPRPAVQPRPAAPPMPPKPAPPLPLPRPERPPIKRSGPPQPPQSASGKKPRPAGGRRRLLLLGVGALAIIIVIAAEVWYFFIRPDAAQEPIARPTGENLPSPEEQLPAELTEPSPPGAAEASTAAPLLSYKRTETLTLGGSTPAAVSAALNQVVNAQHPEGSLMRIILLVEDTGARQRELSLAEIASAVGLTIPQEVLAQLTQEANIFLLPTNVFDQTTCGEAQGVPADCAGPRLGLTVRTRESAALLSALETWERTMVRDLRNLIVADISGETVPFFNATYRNMRIRYRNMPINTVTIDYALAGDLLVITTSKSSMFAAIDAVPSVLP